MSKVLGRWHRATDKSGQYSNFGTLWHQASAQIAMMHNRAAFVCSSGTDAVRLAVFAAQQEHGFEDCKYEPFTFEGTVLAIESVIPVDDTAWVYDLPVVETIPFGCAKFISRSRTVVVDAAGAFGGPGAFDNIPDDVAIAVSFHATKNFPIGEGGCVLLPKEWQALSTIQAMNFGFDDNRVPRANGWATNAKIDELRCAVLLEQLDRIPYFQVRSARIREHSNVIQGAVGGRLGYVPGDWQSLVVVSHQNPAEFVYHMGNQGIVARRVYMPSRHEDLLTEQQKRFVALPSDMTDNELDCVVETIKKVKHK